MGALDSKAFSGAAAIAALLFIVSAIVVVATDDGITGDLTKYVLLIAGIVALIYSFTMFSKGASFVRKAEGILLIITGLMFAVTCFMDTPGDFVAYDGIIAFITILLALLAYWTAGTYGAMYVSAVLAAFEVAMAVYSLNDGYDDVYAAVIFVIFAVFLIVDAVVRPYIVKRSEGKTREVIESPRAQKKEDAKAKRTKATPKAKKAQKEKPAEAPAEPEKKVQSVQPKPQPAPEEPKPAEAAAPAEESEKKEQKRPDKATGEFMEKLMRSKDANAAVKDGGRSEDAQPRKPVRTVKLPDTAALKAEKAKAAAVEEKPAEPVPAPEPAQEQTGEQAPEEKPAEPVVEAKPVIEDASGESVISEPIQAKEEESEFRSVEPDWGHVVKDSSVPEAERREPQPAPVEEEIPEAEPEQEIAPAPEETEPEVEPAPEAAEIQSAPVEVEIQPEPAEPEVQAPAAEQEVAPAPVEEEIPGPESEQEIAPAPEEQAEAPAPEPEGRAPEEQEPQAPAEPAASDDSQKPADAQTEEASADSPSESAEDSEPGEDIYTDNSPEALVRRAAWNKGLRCRRNYGEHSIPVAFVKGKVAVYVTEPGADESVDEALRSEGWTVLRFDADKVTDGKAEGEQIAEAVKANVKTTKKRKARK